jgi:hypothetical protein
MSQNETKGEEWNGMDLFGVSCPVLAWSFKWTAYGDDYVLSLLAVDATI